MPSCVFRKCANYAISVKDKNDVSLHPLPADGLMQVKWIEVIRLQREEPNWLPTSFSLVCSNHFRPEDYHSSTNLRRLKKTAIPVLPNDIKQNSNSDNLNNIMVSDDDLTFYYSSVLNMPVETHFKSEVKKVKAEKRKLKMINNNLYRKNKKLEAKWYRLKNVIADLKKSHRCPQPSKCSVLDNSDIDKEAEQENIMTID